MSNSWPEGRSAERVADALALCIIAAVAVIAAFTFRDYGLGWDDYTHAEYGGLLLNLYASGFSDQRALSFVNLYAYGGGFDMLSALAAKILPFDLFETRRLMGAILGVIGLLLTWRLARRVGGPLAAVIAVALLATCPLYYGNMFMNAKDSPFAVAMVFLTLALVRALEEYPRPSPITCAMVGIGAGLAIGTRVLGGLAAINAFAALALIFAVETRRKGLAQAGNRLGMFAVRFVPAVLLGYAVMALVWPWSVTEPLNLFRAVEYFSHFFEKPWKEMFDGMALPVPDMPRQYVPQLFLLKEPEIFIALGLAGTAGALVAAMRRDIETAVARDLSPARLRRRVSDRARGAHQARDVQRHPAFRVRRARARGAGRPRRCLDRRRFGAARWRPALGIAAAVLLIGLFLPVKEMVRLHPYQYTHFNVIAGGIRAADDHYMLDYWGAVVQAGGTGAAPAADRGLTNADRRAALACRHLRPAAARPGRARPRIPDDLGDQGRRFRVHHGRVLLRQSPAPDPRRDRARGRRLCPRLRHPRPHGHESEFGSAVSVA